MALGHDAVSESPVSATEATNPPAVDRIARGVVRFLIGKPAHPSLLIGRVIRRGGVPADQIIDNPRIVRGFKRNLPTKLPPIQRFRARHLRRGASGPPAPVMRAKALRRIIPAQLPPISEFKARVFRSFAKPPPWVEFAQTYTQGFRVADQSFNVFELYVGIGVGVSPDFDLPPVQTSPTLSFAWIPPSLPSSGSTLDLQFVVRKRNQYNLLSFNVYETSLRIDSSGTEIPGPLTAPKNVAVYEGASGKARVLAQYLNSDDVFPADKWEIYAKEGANPVIGVDAPVFSGDMFFLGEDATLNEEIGTFTPGATLHVLVTALRDSDSERASAAVVQIVLPLAVDLTDGQLFGGRFYEQR